MALLVVLAVDARAVWGSRIGAVAIPFAVPDEDALVARRAGLKELRRPVVASVPPVSRVRRTRCVTMTPVRGETGGKAKEDELVKHLSGISDAEITGLRGGVILDLPRWEFWETTPADWARYVDVNLFGVMNCCRAVLPPMLAQGRGSFINVASVAGGIVRWQEEGLPVVEPDMSPPDAAGAVFQGATLLLLDVAGAPVPQPLPVVDLLDDGARPRVRGEHDPDAWALAVAGRRGLARLHHRGEHLEGQKPVHCHCSLKANDDFGFWPFIHLL